MRKLQVDKYYAFISTSILLSFLLLNVTFSFQKELWLDESHSALLASMNFNNLIIFVKGDVHPPLYFLALWSWVDIFGDAPFPLRAFSIFTHLTSCLFFLLLSRLIFQNKFIVTIIFILFVFSPVLFWYSIEIRMYSMLVMLATISMYSLFRMLKSDKITTLNTVALGTFLALAFYTHYSSIFYIIGVYLFLLYKTISNHSKYLKPLITSGILTLLITSPWYSTLLEQREVKLNNTIEHFQAEKNINTLEYSDSISHNKRTSFFLLKESITNLASIAGVYPAKNIYLLTIGTIPFLIIIIVVLFHLKKSDDLIIFSTFIISISLLGFIFLLELAQRRYMIFLTPVIILTLGHSLGKINEYNKKVTLGIAFLLLLSCIANIYEIITKNYTKPTKQLISELQKPIYKDQLIVINSIHGQIPIEYYSKQMNAGLNLTGVPISIHEWWKSQEFKGWGSPVIYKKDIVSFYNKISKNREINAFSLILFENKQYDHNGFILKYLKENASSVSIIDSYKATNGKNMYNLYNIKVN